LAKLPVWDALMGDFRPSAKDFPAARILCLAYILAGDVQGCSRIQKRGLPVYLLKNMLRKEMLANPFAACTTGTTKGNPFPETRVGKWRRHHAGRTLWTDRGEIENFLAPRGCGPAPIKIVAGSPFLFFPRENHVKAAHEAISLQKLRADERIRLMRSPVALEGAASSISS